MSDCKSYVSKEDLQALKESQLHIEHVAKSKDSAGNHALQVTDSIRGENVTNRTLDGLEDLYASSISEYQQRVESILMSLGWQLMDSFQAGADITERNQALRDDSTGIYYRWDGNLPKNVPAGSTPETTGGINKGAWLAVESKNSQEYYPLLSDLLSANSLTIGSVVLTGGYHSAGVGGAEYLIKSLQSVRDQLNEPTWLPDGKVNHLIGSDNVAMIVLDGEIDVTQAGAISGGVTDATESFNAAIDVVRSVRFRGTYLIDPSVSVIIKDGTVIKGYGQQQSVLLAKYNTSGDVIRRKLIEGQSNEYIQNVICENFSVMLNHIHQDTVPENIQNGFNFRDITRSTIIRCYSGNYRTGIAEKLFPNAANKKQAMRGNLFILGNRTASDPAYCGGEVNKIIDCRAWWGKKGVTIDDYEITGGVSAAYASLVKDCDIQTVEKGISQESRYNTGCTFTDNVIQDLKRAAGSTGKVYGYMLSGYSNFVSGGYIETNVTELDYGVFLDTATKNNTVRILYSDIPDNKAVSDLGSYTNPNIVSRVSDSGIEVTLENNINFSPSRDAAFAVFNGSGSLLKGSNVTSVVRNGAGDYSITWDSKLRTVGDALIHVTLMSNASSHPVSGFVRSHSANSTRISTYNIQTSNYEDFQKIYVSIKK